MADQPQGKNKPRGFGPETRGRDNISPPGREVSFADISKIKTPNQTPEQRLEVDKTLDQFTGILHACQIVIEDLENITFEGQADAVLTQKRNDIKDQVKRIESEIITINIDTIRLIKTDLKLLTQKITRLLRNMEDPTFGVYTEMEKDYQESKLKITTFASASEIKEDKVISPEETVTTGFANVRTVMRVNKLPTRTAKPTPLSITNPVATPAKSPDISVAENLAKEKTRNGEIIERKRGGEDFTIEKLKLAGYDDTSASNLLMVLKLIKPEVTV